VFECKHTETFLSLALRIKHIEGSHAKLPHILCEDCLLHFDCRVMDAGLCDGTELLIVWPAEGNRRQDVSRSHTDVLAARPPDEKSLHLALADVKPPNYELNLAGCHLIGYSLDICLPCTLLALDIRECRMSARRIEDLFQALPKMITVLQASRNAISSRAIHFLKAKSCHFKILDVGYSDLEENVLAFDAADLRPLLGTETEELGLGDIATAEMLIRLAPCCPNLKKLEVNWAGADWNEETANQALNVLSTHCPFIEEIEAKWCPCSKASLTTLVTTCSQLRVLRIGIGGTLGLMGIFDEGRSMDYLEVQVETIEEITVVAQLNIQWLVLSVSPFKEDLPQPFDATQLTRVLADARAWDIELDIPVKFTVECLLAVGVRLRGIAANVYSLLPVLALVAPHCPNLLSLRFLNNEKVSSQDLEKVASSCPLLEIVCLKADRLPGDPIDDGIRALGRYCSNLRHLDLLGRRIEEPCMSLARSCSGWPKLEYLCIGEVYQALQEWHECLPRALARNCPLLQEFIMYPIPSRWRRIMGPSFARLWDREMKCEGRQNSNRI